jgi:hypothetical protein
MDSTTQKTPKRSFYPDWFTSLQQKVEAVTDALLLKIEKAHSLRFGDAHPNQMYSHPRY